MYGPDSLRLMLTIGALFIPSFTRVIAHQVSQNLNPNYLFKKIVCYFPLHFGISILIIETLGFFGDLDPYIRTLGNLINFARTNLYSAPWASFYPGLTIFGMMLSFFLLYIGLQDYGYTTKTFETKFWRSKEQSESLGEIEE
jgi:ABC-type dipeptide/oligopeptide/nickel transport system permease subunit